VRRGKDCVPLTGDLRDRLMVERGDSDFTAVTVPEPGPVADFGIRDGTPARPWRAGAGAADLLRKPDLDLLAALDVLRDGR
jgi:hypothetical protein